MDKEEEEEEKEEKEEKEEEERRRKRRRRKRRKRRRRKRRKRRRRRRRKHRHLHLHLHHLHLHLRLTLGILRTRTRGSSPRGSPRPRLASKNIVRRRPRVDVVLDPDETVVSAGTRRRRRLRIPLRVFAPDGHAAESTDASRVALGANEIREVTLTPGVASSERRDSKSSATLVLPTPRAPREWCSPRDPRASPPSARAEPRPKSFSPWETTRSRQRRRRRGPSRVVQTPPARTSTRRNVPANARRTRRHPGRTRRPSPRASRG